MVKVTVELSAFSHSTELEDRVRAALLNAVPAELRPRLSQRVSIQRVEGYYGNVVTVLRVLVSGSAGLEVLRYILCSMGRTDLEILLATVSSRIEERRARLHLRLGKQDLYLGKVRLYEGGDVVKVVASFEGLRGVELVDYLREVAKSCAG
jgi:RNA binding exosome subunit